MKGLVLILNLLLWLPCLLQAQDERTYIREGNELYNKGLYKEAAAKYAIALGIKKDYLAAYLNEGNALYKQDSLSAAADKFELAAGMATDSLLKARAYHNLGNAHLKAGKYEEALDAYKNALRNNPNDQDTRYNLAYTQGLIKKQPPQDQKNDQQNKDNDKDKDKKGGNNNDPKKDDQIKDDKGQKNDQPKDPKPGEKGNPEDAQKPKDQQKEEKNAPPPTQGQLSKADLERLLEALKNEELKVQQKLQKKEGTAKSKTIEKDW